MERAQLHRAIDLVLDMGEALMGRAVPPEARRHLRAARREALLGVQALTRAALDRMEQEETEHPARSVPLDEA